MADNTRNAKKQQRSVSEEDILITDERPQPVWFDFQAFEMDLNPFEFRVYAHLARRCSRSGRCWQKLKQMAEECQMSERKFRDGLRKLEDLRMIRVIDITENVRDSRRRGWAITRVENWKVAAPHAATLENSGTTCRYIDKQAAPHAAIANQHRDQEEKKDQEEKNIATLAICGDSTAAMNIADEWLNWATTTRPYLASLNSKTFAKAISQLQARHSITDDGMRKILHFVQRDPFWSEQALSPCGLLKRSKNGLYKMENLLASMKTDRSWQDQSILDAPEFEDIDF